jgi:FHA domain
VVANSVADAVANSVAESGPEGRVTVGGEAIDSSPVASSSATVPPPELAQLRANFVGVVLEILNGPLEKKRMWLIRGQNLTIGRTSMADFVIPHDEGLSSVHCEVAWRHGKCIVRDLGSGNGTIVNDRQIAESVIETGDILVVGKTWIRVTLGITTKSEDPPADPPRRALTGSRPFRAALDDPEPAVRQAALDAAAWTRQPWLLDFCRQTARRVQIEHLPIYKMLALLGDASDLVEIQRIANAQVLGAVRFDVVGIYGNPCFVEDLIRSMSHSNPHIAIAAGGAFVKMLGGDVGSDQRVGLPPEGSGPLDAFEQEFVPQVRLPDATLAQQHWDRCHDRLAGATRCCRGFDLSNGVPTEQLDQLDLPSRWGITLREHYLGIRPALRCELTRFGNAGGSIVSSLVDERSGPGSSLRPMLPAVRTVPESPR